ncbi:hypothetical protein [Arthrobacter sp. GMC3]|uniref:hypothetical protein n=1 Tax=Arthrobacter sp. GMC3 TaxID=2058894 RepID=UPI0015E3A713|nr:hypothetical protein [Arthrobacter sp. GMC3]
MTDMESEPVEISTLLGPGEWTEETLPLLAQSYRDRLIDMGAEPESLLTSIDRGNNGSVKVCVSWDRRSILPGGPSTPIATGSLTSGPSEEKIVMYTDDDGTTWVEGRGDSER